MQELARLAEKFPDTARDIRINLQNVLAPGHLNQDQVWGTALACACATRNKELQLSVEADARVAGVSDAVIADAKAAAVMMSMTNVFYRFRHLIDRGAYEARPARLRMQRLAQVAGSKADFELFCLAVSAVNNCQSCVRSHEAALMKQGVNEDQVLDAVRIAATINAAAVAAQL